ncbi:MAG TPA: hypothetical protein VKT32_06790 [Chthonomonadaceae bacterium]|nr:hypothetical protein [Chthonomonadaceae bacterium]
MTRRLRALLVSLGLSLALLAGPAVRSRSDSTTLSQECSATITSVLQSAGGMLTADVQNAYLDWAEKTVLQQLHQSSQTVPESCLTEVRQDGMLRDAMFGSVFPPDPSILQNYATLRAQLGVSVLAKYRSLIIAISVARRIKGVETADQIKNVGRDYQPDFWTDESLQVPRSEPEKAFIRLLAAFMKQEQVSAEDLYEKASLQAQLKTFLAQHAAPADAITNVKKSLLFGEQLKNAMVLLGQRPGAREPKPSAVAWIRHLIALNEATPISTPTQDGKPMPWPLFPIDVAPWPLLMPLAHAVPQSEASYIWEAFQGEHGPDRYHTYGPYQGDDGVMAASLKSSRWFWDAWPDRIVHGGMCVPISKGTVDLYSALNKPAMWAGQPGHANLVSFQYVEGAWTAEIEQAFAGGPDVTTAQWYFDEDPGTQIRFRDLYYWPFSEYHLGLAVGMNLGLKSYMDTRLAAILFRVLPPEQKRTLGVRLLRNALSLNPYNPEIWYRLAEQTSDAGQAMTLVEAALKREPGLPGGGQDSALPIKQGANAARAQYWQTLAQFVARSSLLAHAPPQKIEEMQRVHNLLKSVPGLTGDDLAAYDEKFAASPADPAADDPATDLNLANGGDAYGALRMGERYRDGQGVPQSDAKAQEFFARAASQGDIAAAVLLASLNPAIPRNQITVTASSVYSPMQAVEHLVDESGMTGALHDNAGAAQTMWHTVGQPQPTSPAAGIPASPAWVRFDFAQPTKFESIQIWNHNQEKLTDRGFRRTRIYGSSNGMTWLPLTFPRVIELPRASGTPGALPVTVSNIAAGRAFKSVIVAAEQENGNYDGDCYGLSAVRFVVPRLTGVVPAKAISVTASSVYSPMQAAAHLVDGSGMVGDLHDNADAAQTMWHTVENPTARPPANGLPASPGWVRFDFAQPQEISALLIWNHNQQNLTDRGFRKVRIYASSDGVVWRPATVSPTVELPRAVGSPLHELTEVPTSLEEAPVKSILIAAEAVDGNWGGNAYGLSAVRFVVRHEP